jgi:hypothetical protein
MPLSLKKQSKPSNPTPAQPQQPKVWTISADDGDELMDEDALLAPSDLQVPPGSCVAHQINFPPCPSILLHSSPSDPRPHAAAEASPCGRRAERLRALGGAQGVQKLHLRPRRGGERRRQQLCALDRLRHVGLRQREPQRPRTPRIRSAWWWDGRAGPLRCGPGKALEGRLADRDAVRRFGEAGPGGRRERGRPWLK